MLVKFKMADGARFPVPTFQPHNQRISVPFSHQNPLLPAKFPGVPPNLFSPQSNQTSFNAVRGHVSETLPGQDGMFDNVQRFPSQFHPNHCNLQQDKQPMAMPFPQIQRHPLPASQYINADKQSTNSTTNSLISTAPGQFQFLPSNTQTNMDTNIPQMVNFSSPLPAATPQLLPNNSLQAATHVPVRHEQPSLRACPPPFSGPISVPPPPAPMQFPPPLPGSVTTPMMHLAAPPIIQPLDNSGPVKQETTSQEWINNFLKERGIEKQEKQTQAQSHLKLHEAKQLMADWVQLISELSLQRDKLAALASSHNDIGWRQEVEKAQKLKARVEQIQAYFSSPQEMKQLEQQVLKRKKKREWQKKRRKEEYTLKKEEQERKSTLHQKIDERRSQIIAEDEAKRRAESVKHEAGGVLGEVKRKQTEATKAVDLLKALRKLRDARKQEAEVKGVYLKPTEEESRKFDEKVKWLENVMTRRRELYEAEEKTLRVMLAEEEEEKEKERRENERKTKASLGLSDPMDWFRSFYQQAEHSLPSLLQIRRQWDAFLVPDAFPGASRIPDGYLTPVEPSSDLWATALIDKG